VSEANSLKQHFVFLDELRGIAALSVALLHASQIFGFGLNSHAALAVDFFFCLSGFVLANSYDKNLRSGDTLAHEFLLKRVIRLYPMISVGVLLGAIASLVSTMPYIVPLQDIPILTTGALVLLPLGLFFGQEAFAINNPLWSLCFEMIANGVYGVTGRRKKSFSLDIAILISMAVALSLVINSEGSIGAVGFENWRTFFEGFARVGYSFFAGVLIFRWNINGRLGAVPYQIPMIGLIFVLFFPLFPTSGIYDLVCILFVIPSIVALAGTAKLSNADRPFAFQLGRLSYPFYVLHQPIMRLGAQFQSVTHCVVPLPLIVGLAFIATAGVAHLISEHFDQPLRAYISQRFHHSATRERSTRL
jgi:peptidoglycan/LPS O-acetylase OafA/YrhL